LRFVGGGLAGSTAAAMLGRAGIATVLIDPHETYPFDFRVEKLSGDAQLERFFRTGIADSVLRSATHDGENWIARFGYLLDKPPSRQFGISYENLIRAIRAEIPDPAPLSIGFDLVPVGRTAFDFPAMTYFSERTSDRIPYLTLFPVGGAMRANLFTYREIDDSWLREMRQKPVETMNAVLPRLRRARNRFKGASKRRARPAAASSMSPAA
jgi:hypothetical protein